VFLADFYSRKADFDRVRQIFEESLENVVTVKDFVIVFNSYMKFEEEMLNQDLSQARELDDKLDNLIDKAMNQFLSEEEL
jgi:pre-mRNA-splicing factor SYF1